VTAGAPRRLTGRLRVDLPPEQAFRLFTARGEELWAEGWQPRFAGEVADDAVPGVVWETGEGDATTIWLVLDADPGRGITYARVTPGDRAGTVTVGLREAGTGSDVEVSYVLTPLTGAADRALDGFARGYEEYLAGWQRAIETHLAQQAGQGLS
jgi:hypothetical protein